jgi:hypothetical protein
VAIVGGGAAVPLLTTRLGERLEVPIHTAPQPGFSAAIGAATFGQQHPAARVAASPPIENPTQLASAAPADMTQMLPGARIEEEGPLAWSEDEEEDDPVPYTGPEHSGQYVRDAMEFDDADDDPYAEAAPLPWYKRPALILSLAAAGAAILIAVVLALTLGEESPSPVRTPPSQPTAPPPEQTVTITDTPSPTATTTPPPPPPSTTTEVPTTTYQPPPTTTYQPPVTTTPPPPTTTFTPPVEPTRERRWPWRRY